MAIANKQSHQKNQEIAQQWLSGILADQTAGSVTQSMIAEQFHRECTSQIDWSAYSFEEAENGCPTYSRTCIAESSEPLPICIVAYAWPTKEIVRAFGEQEALGFTTPKHSHSVFCHFCVVSQGAEITEQQYQLLENDTVTKLGAKTYTTGESAVDIPSESKTQYIHTLTNTCKKLAVSCHIYAATYDNVATVVNTYYP